MSDVDQNRALVGFIVSDDGIEFDDWNTYAKSNPVLSKQDKMRGINPFTKEEYWFSNNNYRIVKEGIELGLFAWEEAKCVGVVGDLKGLEDIIADVCESFGGRFDKLET